MPWGWSAAGQPPPCAADDVGGSHAVRMGTMTLCWNETIRSLLAEKATAIAASQNHVEQARAVAQSYPEQCIVVLHWAERRMLSMMKARRTMQWLSSGFSPSEPVASAGNETSPGSAARFLAGKWGWLGGSDVCPTFGERTGTAEPVPTAGHPVARKSCRTCQRISLANREQLLIIGAQPLCRPRPIAIGGLGRRIQSLNPEPNSPCSLRTIHAIVVSIAIACGSLWASEPAVAGGGRLVCRYRCWS